MVELNRGGVYAVRGSGEVYCGIALGLGRFGVYLGEDGDEDEDVIEIGDVAVPLVPAPFKGVCVGIDGLA